MLALVLVLASPVAAAANTLRVTADGDLQAALDAAQPGDRVLLAPGAVFTGSYVLGAKSGSDFITVQTDISQAGAFAPGVRLTPAAAALLAMLQSPSSSPALRTEPGAHHWRIQLLRFGANKGGYGEIIRLGDGDSDQNALSVVPYTIVLDRLCLLGDPLFGQKRGIAMNARDVTVTNSTILNIKAVGQDTQAIAAWNGPGPFWIENNYLEAAGENFLVGGTDPEIYGLTAAGITFRRNYVSRPASWRDPIVPSPQHLTTATIAGGWLAAGTHAYAVVARRPAGQANVAQSLPASITATLGATGSIRLTWTAVPDATEYRVYRSTGRSGLYWTVTQASFTDNGIGGTVSSLPTSGTEWSVKNLFELKNASNVLVEQNVFENNWEAAQSGYAIVITVRNSNGGCTWCTIRHLEFRSNIVRHTGGGVNILGYDDPSRPSLQAQDLHFHDNLFYDIDKTTWGGSGIFVLIGDEPRDVVFDHNTVDHDGTSLISVYGGTPDAPRRIYGFQYTNNMSRHNTYGVIGAGMAYGQSTLDAYFPDGVFQKNLLSDGPASRYPAGNFFSPSFDTQFVNMTKGDFHLISSSPFRLAGTDGADLGPDMSKLPSGDDQSRSPVGPPAPTGVRIMQ
ncbi:MAG TPA: hypothetical protein VFX12_04515 [Vicinamibacterales bacterium]|nr:hypothetical protein [Vicinamibacterales bacterium]